VQIVKKYQVVGIAGVQKGEGKVSRPLHTRSEVWVADIFK